MKTANQDTGQTPARKMSIRDSRIWMPALLLLLALAFNWPYINGGFWADDYMLVNALAQEELPISRLTGAWCSVDVPAFNNLWWEDADFAGSFWRPIPGLVIEGSIRLFGRAALPLHAFGILLHALVTFALYRLVLRLTDQRALAFIAALLFVTCEDHSITISWISTMTDVMSTLFIVLALIGHASYLQTGRARSLIGSIAALLVALGCKETAVVTPLAMLLMSILLPRGVDQSADSLATIRGNFKSMLAKPGTWLPAVTAFVAYLIAYRALGFGNLSSVQYVHPLSEPIRYVIHAAGQLPTMWLATLSIWSPSITAFARHIVPYIILPGLAAFVFWIVALWPMRNRALVIWAMLFYLLALLPHLSTDGGERGLYLPFVAASVLLALLAQTVGPIARRIIPTPDRGTRWTRIAGWMTILAVILPGTLVSTVRPWLIVPSFRAHTTQVLTALPHIEKNRPEHLVITNASTMLLTYYCENIIEFHAGQSPNVWLLSAAHGKYSLQRTGETSIVINAHQPGWIGNTMALYARTDEDVEAGELFVKDLYTVTVLEVTGDGKDVLAARFDFAVPFDDPSLLIVRWNGEVFEPLDISAMEVGETVTLFDNGTIWETLL